VSDRERTLDDDAESLLRSRFEYGDSDSYASPSGNYYWFRKRREVATLVRRYADLFDTCERPAVVELGCGEGDDLFMLRRLLPQASFLGLEIDPERLRICELRRRYHGAENVSFLSADLTRSLPVADNAVDLAYCSEVVEHLPQPEELLAEIARIVRPGGLFLLTTPNQPNVLQRSFWSRRRSARIQSALRAEREETGAEAEVAGHTPIFGHISLRTARQWDRAVEPTGFELLDWARGALMYGTRRRFDREPVLALMFLAQTMLDLLPKRLTRPVSDQAIALYRRL
jgi:SAM-dependent methyltransferase